MQCSRAELVNLWWNCSRPKALFQSKWGLSRRVAGLIYVFTCLLLGAPLIQAELHDERAVKAAFVFNLTKYVEWPAISNEMIVGFVGDDSSGELLKRMLEGKTSDSKAIRVLLSPSDQELERCNILYIADLSPAKVRAALDGVHGKSVLTVGNTESFVQQGGMIGLVTVGEQVQIQVALKSVQASKLKISSRLLNIAVLIDNNEARK